MVSRHYAAGLYEGEGTIRLHGRATNWRHVYVRILMTDIEPLERMVEFTGGKVLGPYHHGVKPTKPTYCWNLTAVSEARSFIGSIGDLLSPRRQEQAWLAFDEYERWQRAHGRKVL